MQPSMQLVGRPERTQSRPWGAARYWCPACGRAIRSTAAVVHLNDNLTEAIAARRPGWSAFSSELTYWPVPLECRPRRGPPVRVGRGAATLDLTAKASNHRLGYRLVRNYRWLQVPVLDSSGEIIHTAELHRIRACDVIGLRFLRRRDASFIGAVGADAAELAADIHRHVIATPRVAA